MFGKVVARYTSRVEQFSDDKQWRSASMQRLIGNSTPLPVDGELRLANGIDDASSSECSQPWSDSGLQESIRTRR